jgi:tRNA A37 N6-isopentenylltransferase MiaA
VGRQQDTPTYVIIQKMISVKTAVFIVGPTTVGKTDVAYAFARSTNGQVVNGDAYELYQEFSLCNGTSDALRHADIPKHLYQILTPMEEVLTPEQYAVLASRKISEITNQNTPAIVEIYRKLYLATLRTAYPDNVIVCLEWKNPNSLAERIRERWENVWSEALIDEVRQALEKGYRESLVLKEALVAKYIVRYLDGKISLDEAKEGIVNENIALARRDFAVLQMTPGLNWVKHDPLDMDSTLNAIKKLLLTKQTAAA